MRRTIKNRKELTYYINKNGVETNLVESNSFGKFYETIAFDKENECFYKIKWGNVISEGKSYLWYDEKLTRVILSKSGDWITKAENEKRKEKMSMYKYKTSLNEIPLFNVKPYVKSNDIVPMWKEELEITASNLIEGKKVMIISSKGYTSIKNEIVKTISGKSFHRFNEMNATDEDLLNVQEAIRVVSEGDLVFSQMKDDLSALREIRKVKPDFLLIGSLQLNNSESELNNNNQVIEFHKKLSDLALELNFNAIVVNKISQK